MIGVLLAPMRPSTAPTFGVENMLGTNPLTFGFPTDEEFPFMLDCASSITQRGKIEYYAREGKPTPAGMVIGHDGSAMDRQRSDSGRPRKRAGFNGTAGRNRWKSWAVTRAMDMQQS